MANLVFRGADWRLFGPVLAGLLAPCLSAQRSVTLRDVYFITSDTQLQASSIFSPFSNAKGDVTARVLLSSGNWAAFTFTDANLRTTLNSGAVAGIKAFESSGTSAWYLSGINSNAAVLSLNVSSGTQRLYRHDLSGGSYTASLLITATATSTLGFSFISPAAGLTGLGTTYTYAEHGIQGKGIFLQSQGLLTSTTGASFPEQAAWCSNSANFVFIAAVGGSTAVYNGLAPVASTPLFGGFGRRPNINDFGTVAFFGSKGGTMKPYTVRPSGTPRLVGSFDTLPTSPIVGEDPQSVQDTLRLALNNLNQCAFLGKDTNGNTSVFTTSLGALRPVFAIGDSIDLGGQQSKVTGLGLDAALTDSGLVTFVATLANGRTVLLRMPRYPYQSTKVKCINMPGFVGIDYLLKSVPLNEGGKTPDGVTIGTSGCNLTCTAALLTFFGFPVTPLDLQKHLIALWKGAGGGNNRFIDRNSNDFKDDFVAEYTLSRGGPSAVFFKGMHKNSGSATNVKAILASLRKGAPVKLRVPNSKGEPFGHYVLIYGLRDPDKADGNITIDDFLVHDPADDQVQGTRSLLDYENAKNLSSGWLEANDGKEHYRVYLYELQAVALAPADDLWLSCGNDADVLLKDSNSRRVGFANGAAFAEMQGSQTYREVTYSFSDLENPQLPVWDTTAERTTIAVSGAVPGLYSLEVTSQTGGSFEIVSSLGAGASSSSVVLKGNVPPMGKTVVPLRLPGQGVQTYGLPTAACGIPIQIGSTGIPTRGATSFAITCDGAPTLTAGALMISANSSPETPFLGLSILVGLAGPLVIVPVNSDSNGAQSTPLTVPVSVAIGSHAYCQYVWANTALCGGVGTLSSSNAADVTVR